MWETDEIAAHAAGVARVAGEVSGIAVDLGRCSDIDFRSRAADLLRQRMVDLLTEILVARRACDDAAEALRDHGAAVARWMAALR